MDRQPAGRGEAGGALAGPRRQHVRRRVPPNGTRTHEDRRGHIDHLRHRDPPAADPGSDHHAATPQRPTGRQRLPQRRQQPAHDPQRGHLESRPAPQLPERGLAAGQIGQAHRRGRQRVQVAARHPVLDQAPRQRRRSRLGRVGPAGPAPWPGDLDRNHRRRLQISGRFPGPGVAGGGRQRDLHRPPEDAARGRRVHFPAHQRPRRQRPRRDHGLSRADPGRGGRHEPEDVHGQRRKGRELP